MFTLTGMVRRPAHRRYRYIAVVGNVGTGKSTLALHLAQHLGWEVSLERVDTNPYVGPYYRDPDHYALQSQLSFLTQRVADLMRLQSEGRNHVQDCLVDLYAEVFARRLYDTGVLNRAQWDLYQHLYRNLTQYAPQPDLTIFLTGSLETNLRRIRMRNRSIERDVPDEYWADLRRRYEESMARYDRSPVLRVNIDQFNCLGRNDHLQRLATAVSAILDAADGEGDALCARVAAIGAAG